MKRKHYGVLVFVIMALSVMVVGLDAFYTLGNFDRALHPSRLRSPLVMSVPGQNALREISRLNAGLASLAIPPEQDSSDVNLALFGYLPGERHRYRKTGKEGLLPSGMDYSISFAFSSNTKGFCVIDKAFFQKGSALKDGARIIEIESRRVLIEKDGFKVWIPVGKSTKLPQAQEERARE